MITHGGLLPSGSRYVVDVPARWNGVLLLRIQAVPVGPDAPPWASDDPLSAHLTRSGYAVAGSATNVFWPVERALSDLPSLLDLVETVVGTPRQTIALGFSIGGIISAGAVQRYPEQLSGALPMCANLAGAVANHNRELDMAFVVKTLLASDTVLEVVRIADPEANLMLASEVLQAAQSTAAGRARLALLAAIGDIPGWHGPAKPAPAADDFDARQRNQFAWLEDVGFLVFFWARRQVEIQAGGNPSWNADVDYRQLLSTSINRDEVEALYPAGGLDLDKDLDRLAGEERIEADRSAVAYLERHIVFTGDLGGVPVLTMHTEGDGLVTPGQEQAYADVVRHAGHQDFLRQLYVDRGGHCTFTFAEILTALDLLRERIDSGAWPVLDPAALNDIAARFGVACNMLPSGKPTRGGFCSFDPPRFTRQYDVRHIDGKGRNRSASRVP
ncbi:MAG: hypothetical protein ACR2KK_15205 [Acidimicrobiales bacterium]